jgi:hypothetical protein
MYKIFENMNGRWVGYVHLRHISGWERTIRISGLVSGEAVDIYNAVPDSPE